MTTVAAKIVSTPRSVLFGTVNVLRGSRAPGDPTDSERRTIEGWILGQVDL